MTSKAKIQEAQKHMDALADIVGDINEASAKLERLRKDFHKNYGKLKNILHPETGTEADWKKLSQNKFPELETVSYGLGYQRLSMYGLDTKMDRKKVTERFFNKTLEEKTGQVLPNAFHIKKGRGREIIDFFEKADIMGKSKRISRNMHERGYRRLTFSTKMSGKMHAIAMVQDNDGKVRQEFIEADYGKASESYFSKQILKNGTPGEMASEVQRLIDLVIGKGYIDKRVLSLHVLPQVSHSNRISDRNINVTKRYAEKGHEFYIEEMAPCEENMVWGESDNIIKKIKLMNL